MKLRAGDLKMEYDQGFLRYIKLGNHEVLRMIYFALRDHNWDTMPGTISEEVLQIKDRSFDVAYKWTSTAPEFPFVWQVEIHGGEDEQIVFQIEGQALADVRKNRTGFCILHPIVENAGNSCTVITPTGEICEHIFPKHISPHQPFFDIRKMKWPIADLGKAEITFEGDVFETEDQRNWTDDSYKTYCTPLRIPFPADLKKGAKVLQKVVLDVNKWSPVAPIDEGVCLLTPELPMPKVPSFGVGAMADQDEPARADLAKIASLGFDWYHLEIDFSRSDWREIWSRRLSEVSILKFKLHITLNFTDNFLAEASEFNAELLKLSAETHVNILLLHKSFKTSPEAMLDLVEPIFRKGKSNIKIGAGTNVYFTELNRERVKIKHMDFVSYSVNPQVHAFDNASMTENLQAQAYTVESAREYYKHRAIHVAPITLKPRFNPNATSAQDDVSGVTLPADVDPRQSSLYAAAWTLGSVLHLARAQADLLVYYETIGWKGLFQGAQVPPNYGSFPTQKNLIFPVYHIFRVILSFKGNPWIPLASSQTLQVKGLAFKTDTGLTLLIANFKSEPQSIQLKYPCQKYRVALLDESTQQQALQTTHYFKEKIEVAPYIEKTSCSLTLTPNAIAYVEIAS